MVALSRSFLEPRVVHSRGEYAAAALMASAGAVLSDPASHPGEAPSGDLIGAVGRQGGFRLLVADLQGDARGAEAYHGRLARHLHERPDVDPVPWLEELDHDWPGERFTSLALVDVDDQGHTFCLASAGHPPALVRSPGGAVESVGARATFGLIGATFAPRPVPLPVHAFVRDSWVGIPSDGVIEAGATRHEAFGLARLRSAIQDALSPLHALELVRRRVATHLRGAPLDNDLSLLIVWRQGPEAR